MNTVDVIFPSWPLFLYTNPELGKFLLLPLFEYQATGQYPNKWSVHDMGTLYILRPIWPFVDQVPPRRQVPTIHKPWDTMMEGTKQCRSKV